MLAASVVLGVVAAWAASAKLNFATVPTPSIQPRSMAFGIWLIIFPLLLASAVLYAGEDSLFPPRAVVALVASLALASAWAAALHEDWRRMAALLLLLSTVSAWVSSAWSSSEAAAWLLRLSLGLYAGWLSVATLLALAIALPARTDTPWSLLVGSVVVATASVSLKQPFACASVAWALLLQKEDSVPAALALCVAILGGVGAGIRP